MSQAPAMTLGDLLDRTASDHPHHEALVDLSTGRSLTYAEFSRETDRLARGFMALGFPPGFHMALWGGSSIPWILTQYAAAKAGIVVVSVDPEYDAEQLAYILEQSESEALVVIGGYKDRDYPSVIRELRPETITPPNDPSNCARLPRLRRLILAGDRDEPGFMPWEHLFKLGEVVADDECSLRKGRNDSTDVTLISYTSGTTGAPKGVMCTHEGLINKSSLSAGILGLGPGDRAGLCVPLYHMFGNTCALLTGMTRAATLVLFGQYFETGAALKGLAEGKCTVTYGAPSQFIAMMAHPLYRQLDLSRLRGGIMGGAPCPMEVMKKVVHDMGLREILVGFGQTEASSWVTLTRRDDPLEVRVSTIGRPLDHTEVKIVDPGTGLEVPTGTAGELCTRGFLMAGYYNMPAATAKALDPDGWLHTGDLAVMLEDDNLRIVGRMKDLILGDGVEIAPTDVEEVLYTHPDIVEAAAFGVPGPGGFEQVAAWVKLRDGATVDPSAVVEFCRAKLPKDAIPALIHVTDYFPMTATGKIQKFKMKEITMHMRSQTPADKTR